MYSTSRPQETAEEAQAKEMFETEPNDNPSEAGPGMPPEEESPHHDNVEIDFFAEENQELKDDIQPLSTDIDYGGPIKFTGEILDGERALVGPPKKWKSGIGKLGGPIDYEGLFRDGAAQS